GGDAGSEPDGAPDAGIGRENRAEVHADRHLLRVVLAPPPHVRIAGNERQEPDVRERRQDAGAPHVLDSAVGTATVKDDAEAHQSSCRTKVRVCPTRNCSRWGPLLELRRRRPPATRELMSPGPPAVSTGT